MVWNNLLAYVDLKFCELKVEVYDLHLTKK